MIDKQFVKQETRRSAFPGALIVVALVLVLPLTAAAQTWQWSSQLIDAEGTDSSVHVDANGNVHVSYRHTAGGQLKYGFLPAGGSRWFTVVLDQLLGDFLTGITVDENDNPFICYTPGTLKTARFDGHEWKTQQVDPGGGLVGFFCNVRVGNNHKPQISWYVDGTFRLKHAILENGLWMAQNVDVQDLPGKINSMVLDTADQPHLSYIGLYGPKLKYAHFDGSHWIRSVLDASDKNPAGGDRGMGNSIILDPQGNPMISYFNTQALRFARIVDGQWKYETLDQFPPMAQWGWRNFRSAMALDPEGRVHIVYESVLGLKHAWWDGAQWKKQLLLPPAGTSFDGGMALDAKGNLYYSYTDPADRSLQLAIGRYVPASVTQMQNTKAPN